MKKLILFAALIVIANTAYATHPHDHSDPYSVQPKRNPYEISDRLRQRYQQEYEQQYWQSEQRHRERQRQQQLQDQYRNYQRRR